MYKATASGQQFLAREAMHSTKGSRRGFDLLDHGANPASVLSLEEQRASMVASVKALTQRLSGITDKQARATIGQQLYELNTAINALRPKMKGSPNVASFFIEVAKERLSKAVYQSLMDEAADRERAARRGP